MTLSAQLAVRVFVTRRWSSLRISCVFYWLAENGTTLRMKNSRNGSLPGSVDERTRRPIPCAVASQNGYP